MISRLLFKIALIIICIVAVSHYVPDLFHGGLKDKLQQVLPSVSKMFAPGPRPVNVGKLYKNQGNNTSRHHHLKDSDGTDNIMAKEFYVVPDRYHDNDTQDKDEQPFSGFYR